ncbi:MAG: roadblock/LC7 domain-containing protein [Candidatus Thorarchaeota archaeon]|jgi:predicted regulator of Ras-like GTPase activity (Roadblock/LC7/MglB family)
MSAKIKKLEQCLKSLQADSEVDGCALVSNRGQLMAASLDRGTDQKAVSAMAAALMSIGAKVGSALESGVSKSIVIEGNKKVVFVRNLNQAALIATAPRDSKIGLIDFEMDKVTTDIAAIL